MTCQPAIQVGLFLLMAFDTESHLEIFTLKSIHLLNGAVAFLAGHLFFDVALVIKHDMLGQIIYLHPGRGRIRIEISVFL